MKHVTFICNNKQVFIDEEDLEKLNFGRNMELDSKGYVKLKKWVPSLKKEIRLPIHRLVMNCFDSKVFVDHKNHNIYDNRKINLRLCSPGQSRMNSRKRAGCSSQYKGVSFYKKYKKWAVRIKKDKKAFFLGYFFNEIAAAAVYDAAAKELHKGFAVLNFPEGDT